MTLGTVAGGIRGVTIGSATCAKAPTSEPSQRSLNPKVERLRTFQEHLTCVELQ